MRTNIYIDGFNLYYGALKGTPFKWLNVAQMCQHLLPHNQLAKIKYFTANVSARPDDPDKPIKQQTYFRALKTLPNLEVILGHFLVKECMMPLAGQPADAPKFVKVVKFEEKGSDVNLATHLLHDGHNKEYEVAVLITNDSDLLEAIRIVRQELNLPSVFSIRTKNLVRRFCVTLLSSSRFEKGFWLQANFRILFKTDVEYSTSLLRGKNYYDLILYLHLSTAATHADALRGGMKARDALRML